MKTQKDDFWKIYMTNWWGVDLVEKSNVIEETWIKSKKVNLHLEIYDTKKQAPTIVFIHGLVGHARITLPFTMPLFERGYNIIAPDLMGYGETGKALLKGDFTWNHWLENTKDVIEYARKRFGGPIILAGASMGGPVAFSTAMRFDNVDGVICFGIWNLQNPDFIKAVVSYGKFTYLVLQFYKLMKLLIPKVRIKNSILINYDLLTDDQELNNMFKYKDPSASTLISVRAAVSLLTQSKWEKPLTEFKTPVLFFIPTSDQMIPLSFPQNIFDELKGKKRWVNFEGSSHMTSKPYYFKEVWAPEIDNWIKEAINPEQGK